MVTPLSLNRDLHSHFSLKYQIKCNGLFLAVINDYDGGRRIDLGYISCYHL